MANLNNDNFFAQLLETNTKVRYQEFIAELGIERVKVLIPLDKAKAFEAEALEAKPEFIKELKSIAKKYEGFLSEEEAI